MKRAIDWSSPSYVTSTASNALRHCRKRHCCHCDTRILVGKRFKRGPRGFLYIHESCVAPWTAKQAIEQAALRR
jgi:hypothetical protein